MEVVQHVTMFVLVLNQVPLMHNKGIGVEVYEHKKQLLLISFWREYPWLVHSR